jgi:GrpB-like predicted nucleotidyltransferase (UPF0157 family)
LIVKNKDDPGPQGPQTDAEIEAAMVGDKRIINSTIELVPYDPEWQVQFEQLRKQIRQILKDQVLLLEHVGSTSVPGLSAKPVIDMVLVVKDSSDEASYVRPLENIGYTLRIREPEWYQHRVLCPPHIRGNLHVFSPGAEEIDRMVLFRDWLRTHPEDKDCYEKTKRELAARMWKYVQNYADAKSEVVADILSKALRSRAGKE